MEIRKFHPCRALFYEELEEMQYDMENELGIAIEESTEYGPVEQMCPPMSKALHDDVKLFYCHDETSRILPHSRYSTKHEPARVINSTIKAAYAAFLDRNPAVKIGLTLFQSLRPKNCRLMGSVPLDSCLCIYCTNVRLKINTLNQKLGSSGQIPPEKDMLYFLTCPNEERWPKIDCIDGKCSLCSDRMRLFKALCRDLYRDANELKWQRWERNEEGKMEPRLKEGSLSDLLEELEKDLTEPTKGTSFVQHLFTAYWQYHQFKQCRQNPEEGEVVMVQDFGENRKAAYSAEIKSAHFGKQQITVHPIVCFYRKGDSVVRESLIFLSDDIIHDHHAVQEFTKRALVELEKSIRITKLTIWSDGAASQYKGRGSFYDLTLLPYQSQRCYYGSEHGKGESDGETGILSQALKRATHQGINFPSAKEMVDFLERTMGTDRRKYLLVEVIDRTPPLDDIQVIPGTRKFHQFQAMGEFVVQARRLSCFCTACREAKPGRCLNQEVVGPYSVHKCRQGTTLNETSAQALETGGNIPTVDAEPENPWPNVGDFIKLTAQIYKSRKTYYATVIEVNKESKNFSVRFLQRSGTKYSFGENDDVGLVAPGPPDFYAWVIMCPSQWKMDHREHYSFLL